MADSRQSRCMRPAPPGRQCRQRTTNSPPICLSAQMSAVQDQAELLHMILIQRSRPKETPAFAERSTSVFTLERYRADCFLAGPDRTHDFRGAEDEPVSV